ncbi:NAD-dependent epimerase/dehydratase [Pseudomonas sp. 8Z]|uniref:NAD(P)H-binding protein n=1 Tax=Pseudomonas sp. 8Z TaxID=2653166 RepID=UPI0012F145F3|nr:NAD(P)H-binding protein [Pseudomonas sp. 8Z]VXD04503.1 NAD-dependent epimerase/dehydratase [Pseudomonas sp. 8Z]
MPQISLTSAHTPRIAVAGATGRVGSALINALSNDPIKLIALTRKPDPAHFATNVAQATVDFDNLTTLQDALQGAERLFLAHGTSPWQAKNEIALIDAAIGAGVRHIVKLSVFGPPLRLHPYDWHTRIESYLSTCDIGYTLLRPTTFFDVLALGGESVMKDTWGGAAGNGTVNLIDTRDIADCARAVLLDPNSNDYQRAFHLTGEHAWSMPKIAEELSFFLGRDVRYHHRSLAEHRKHLLSSGKNELVADVLTGLDLIFSQSVLSESTSTVQVLTGHAPRTLPAWLLENIAMFGELAQER